MRTSVSTRGLSAPRSQRETTDWVVPIAAASATCVSPAPVRAAVMSRPRSVRASGLRSAGAIAIAETYYSGAAISARADAGEVRLACAGGRVVGAVPATEQLQRGGVVRPREFVAALFAMKRAEVVEDDADLRMAKAARAL